MKSITPTSTIPPVLGDRKINLMIFLLLILSPAVGAQPSFNNNNNNSRPYAFSPSMAIIIVVLVAALFFMAFFSIYIRRCSGNNGNTIRNALSMHARRGNAAARGLDAAVIETFPTFSYAEVKDHKVGKGALECAVCLNEFEDDETLRLIPKCDHVFHPECIDAWLESHVTCPVCRTDLTPQPDEPSYLIPDPNQETRENNDNIEQHPRNDDVSIQVSDDQALEGIAEDSKDQPPPVKRSSSLKFPTRPPRTESVRRGRTGFGRFRSHSTGHSLVQPVENVDRFTLRLPEELRKEMMNRAYLNRTKSYAMGLPRDASSRRGNRTGVNDGISIGGSIRSFSRVERSDRAAKSDRWVFSKAPPFFTRAVSTLSPRETEENGEGSTSSKSGRTAVKMPSFRCLEPKSSDEAVLVHSDSVRPPV